MVKIASEHSGSLGTGALDGIKLTGTHCHVISLAMEKDPLSDLSLRVSGRFSESVGRRDEEFRREGNYDGRLSVAGIGADDADIHPENLVIACEIRWHLDEQPGTQGA